MSEKITKNTEQLKNEQETTKEKLPGWMIAGRLGLAAAILASGANYVADNARDTGYEKAANEAVVTFNNLTFEDFMRVQSVNAEVGPTISVLGSTGKEETATIRLETELAPGNKIKDPLLSDEGIEAGGESVEIVWSPNPPLSVYSYGDTGSGLKRGAYQRVVHEKADGGEKGNVYKQLMDPSTTDPIEASFLIPVDIGDDGETRFDIEPTVHKVGLSGVDQDDVRRETASPSTFFKDQKNVISSESAFQVVMKVENGQITSVELQ